jgi:hypothetical protein
MISFFLAGRVRGVNVPSSYRQTEKWENINYDTELKKPETHITIMASGSKMCLWKIIS